MNESTETSGPVRYSSTTIVELLSPNCLSSIIECIASTASFSLSARITPLPSASPSAFITAGYVFCSLTYFIASSLFVNTSYLAVGILYFFIRSLEKTFEPSIIAAFFLGPNVLNPSACKASTIPSTSGSSGATATMSTLSFFARATTPSISVAATSKHSA